VELITKDWEHGVVGGSICETLADIPRQNAMAPKMPEQNATTIIINATT